MLETWRWLFFQLELVFNLFNVKDYKQSCLGHNIGRAPHLIISVVKPVISIYVCNMIIFVFCLVMNR